MSRVVDARVKLPMELRPENPEPVRSEYRERYDEILHLDERRNKTLAELLEDIDQAGIDHAIVHAEYEFGDPADAMNEAVAELVRANPGLFSGFGTISMEHLRPMRAVRQVERIAALGLIGVNIQPAFFGAPIDDRRYYPAYAKAAELSLPVAVHTGSNYSVVHPLKNDHPLLLDQVACDLPELMLVACNAGWPWVPEMVAVARKHSNVLMDFGGLAPKYIGVAGSGWEVMRKFMDGLLVDQLLFASDWPVFPMDRAVSEWKGLGLKPEALSAALGSNAERLISDVEKEVRRRGERIED